MAFLPQYVLLIILKFMNRTRRRDIGAKGRAQFVQQNPHFRKPLIGQCLQQENTTYAPGLLRIFIRNLIICH
jgi:hypothetical protein